MIIKAILLEPEVSLKVAKKHGVPKEEMGDVLMNDEPIFRKAGGDQYLAIGLSKSRYLTIFFSYDRKTKEAEIATAYPSDEGQIRFYRRQRR